MSNEAANRTLNWVLAVYQDPNAKPGVVPNAFAARRTIEELNDRAIRRAALLGIKDESTGKDAVGSMFEALGRSRIAETFDASIAGAPQYINAILDRFVLRHVLKMRDGQTVPLSADISDGRYGPSKLAEIGELECLCEERTRGLPAWQGINSEERLAMSSIYVRRHRVRMRRWRAIADLFPNLRFRPRRRPRRLSGILTSRRVIAGRARTARLTPKVRQ